MHFVNAEDNTFPTGKKEKPESPNVVALWADSSVIPSYILQLADLSETFQISISLNLENAQLHKQYEDQNELKLYRRHFGTNLTTKEQSLKRCCSVHVTQL